MTRTRKKTIPLTKSPSSTTISERDAAATVSFLQPPLIRSRKRARRITTLFHKFTKQREDACQRGNIELVRHCDEQLLQMGGRPAYQRASQASASFYSTSKKWVLPLLAQNGWLYGIPLENEEDNGNTNYDKTTNSIDITSSKRNYDEHKEAHGTDKTSFTKTTVKQRRKVPRRTARILEVGAINTDLLDAATKKDGMVKDRNNGPDTVSATTTKYKCQHNIHVRSIDLHAMDPRIEQAGFLTLDYLHPQIEERYDVVVCSMVLNSVTNAVDRGKMLCRLYHHLRYGGLCLLTLPQRCLTQSAFLTPSLFLELLGDTGVGFELVSTKDSPKISYFVLRRPLPIDKHEQLFDTRPLFLDPKWTKKW